MSSISQNLADTGLPLVPHLDTLVQKLAARKLAVLRADPGSGKSTLVPLSCLDSPAFNSGKIIMLEPRRVAAVSVADRMASLLGEKLGERVGYAVRLDRCIGPSTRVEVLTEGLLVRRLQGDPDLSGVSLLIFDEFHERSLPADLALALALDLRKLRPELAILIMSATMDTQRVAAYLGNSEEPPDSKKQSVPIIDCRGTPYPVEISYKPLSERGKLGEELGKALAFELAQRQSMEAGGDTLVFLPGLREIQDVERICRPLLGSSFDIFSLHGSLPLSEQRKITAGKRPGERRRIILSTNLAETSLTVPGIDLVVDSGFVRIQRYQFGSAMDRLVLERSSKRSADQRTGRAGRLARGRCIRLWSETDVINTETEPEMGRVELSSLVLDCALWGARGRDDLSFLDMPSERAWEDALETLRELGALDSQQRPTERGRKMATLGLSPRLAALVLYGQEQEQLDLACMAAAALSDRDSSGISDDADFRRRLAVLRLDDEERREGGETGSRKAWRERCRSLALDLKQRLRQDKQSLHWTLSQENDLGILLAAAFPDRIARRQESLMYRFPQGREARLFGPLEREEWIVAVEADAGERSGFIRLCAPLDKESAERALQAQSTREIKVEWKELLPRTVERNLAGRLLLSEKRRKSTHEEIEAALPQLLQEKGLSVLPWEEGKAEALRYLQRIRFRAAILGGIEKQRWSDESLVEDAELWLAPFISVEGPIFSASSLKNALLERLSYKAAQELAKQVPEFFITPAHTTRPFDYSSDQVALDVKIQELFGLSDTPRVLGVPVVLRLLSPAQRPIQLTSDLAGFWKGSYTKVRKELRGRYPKHHWPEDPLNAEASKSPKRRNNS
ncbi:ATP-dependent helicase HrpB [Treponema sp.]